MSFETGSRLKYPRFIAACECLSLQLGRQHTTHWPLSGKPQLACHAKRRSPQKARVASHRNRYVTQTRFRAVTNVTPIDFGIVFRSSGVERRINSEIVLERLSDVSIRRRVPKYIRSDNGSEFIATKIAIGLRGSANNQGWPTGLPGANSALESPMGQVRFSRLVQ